MSHPEADSGERAPQHSAPRLYAFCHADVCHFPPGKGKPRAACHAQQSAKNVTAPPFLPAFRAGSALSVTTAQEQPVHEDRNDAKQ